MRWIHCDCCDRGKANAMVFDQLAICYDCRTRVIDFWMGVLGFNLGPHPFIDEFMGVETLRDRRKRLESYEPSDSMSMVNSESEIIVDNTLDILDSLC